MNKTILTQQVAGKMLITQRESARFINTLQAVLTHELQQNGRIMLQGFGTISLWEQTEREGRNPKTGKPCTILQRTSVKFKPGKQLLKALNKTK